MIVVRVIDTETTGIPEDGDTERHGLVEVARCDVTFHRDGRIDIGAPRSMLVNPGRSIDVEAKAAHHITEAEVAGALPEPAAFAFLTDDPPDYFAAHKADFDRQFFNCPHLPWICTYKVACRVYPDAPRFSNQVLRYWLDLDERMDHALTMPAHRAAPDSYVTAHLLAAMVETGTSLETMARWSSGYALLPRVTFGEHYGKPWTALDNGYLRWIVEKATRMDPETIANARYHLRQRGAL